MEVFLLVSVRMKIQELLEQEHSREQTDKVVLFVGNDKGRFAELMELVLANKKTVSQRAAWAMSLVVLEYPFLFEPYFEPIITLIRQPNAHDSILRNSLKILAEIPVPVQYQGLVVDICFEFILEPQKPSAIKAFAITCLQNICYDQPALASEVKLILAERMEFEKPAYISRAKKFLKEF
jgi:hypothetical protein